MGTASRWLPATAMPLPSMSGSSPAEACRREAMGFWAGAGRAQVTLPTAGLAKVSQGQEGATRAVPQDAADTGRCRCREEARRPGESAMVCSAEGKGTEIKKSPAKIRKAGAHSALLWSCHTSLYFIAFVQHPIVPLPFVPYSQPWLFITQPALLFSFLLFEVPERKVLFSAV